jgi:hypothetical protein
VAGERARLGELAELVADHVFRDVDGNELLSVVHGERVAHEVGRNHRGPAPRLDDALSILLVELVHLAPELVVDVGTFA